MKRLITLLPLILIISACASVGSNAPAPEPVIYFTVNFEGDALTGTMDAGQFIGNFSGKKR